MVQGIFLFILSFLPNLAKAIDFKALSGPDRGCEGLVKYSQHYQLPGGYESSHHGGAPDYNFIIDHLGDFQGHLQKRIFSFSHCRGENFNNTVLYFLIINLSRFERTTFNRSHFILVDLSFNHIFHSSFHGSGFYYSSLFGTQIAHSQFEFTKFYCTDLSHANLGSSTYMGRAFDELGFCSQNIYDSNTVFPRGVTCPDLSREEISHRLENCERERDEILQEYAMTRQALERQGTPTYQFQGEGHEEGPEKEAPWWGKIPIPVIGPGGGMMMRWGGGGHKCFQGTCVAVPVVD